MLAIELPPEAEARLDAVARAAGRTKAACARDAILEYLDDMEDLRIAEQRLADNRAGRSQSVPLEDVMRRYGLEATASLQGSTTIP